MIKINISKQSDNPVSSPNLKKKLQNFFREKGIVSDAEVSVAFVGEAKMLDLGKKYLKDKKLHNVFSFTPDEVNPDSIGENGNFIYPPDGLLHLGEIIVCYPQAFREAKNENIKIEDKIYELVEHGAMHLMGIHHKE